MSVSRFILPAIFLMASSLAQAESVGSAFTYQGELQQLGVPFVRHNVLHDADYFIPDAIIVNTKIPDSSMVLPSRRGASVGDWSGEPSAKQRDRQHRTKVRAATQNSDNRHAASLALDQSPKTLPDHPPKMT